MGGPAEHWDRVYESRAPDEVSWHQAEPSVSLRLLGRADTQGSLIDLGAGTSTLADELLGLGWSKVTLLDVSAEALRAASTRLAPYGDRVELVVADVLMWAPATTFDAWHDRAVFHFLTDSDDQSRYVATAARAVRPGGLLVMGTFAADGPTRCSGLPTARHDAASLGSLFSDSFELVHSEREEHVTPSGDIQPFTWVVLRRG